MQVHTANMMFQLALKSHNQAATHDEAPIIAIVFSAIALETWTVELAQRMTEAAGVPIPDSVRHAGLLLQRLNDDRARLMTKLGTLIGVLKGTAPDYGSEPLQSVHRLVQVRNALVHRTELDTHTPVSTFEFTKGRPKCLKQLESAGVCLRDESECLSWVDELCTPSVSEWACGVSSSATRHISDCLPDSYFRSRERQHYVLRDFSRTIPDAPHAPDH